MKEKTVLGKDYVRIQWFGFMLVFLSSIFSYIKIIFKTFEFCYMSSVVNFRLTYIIMYTSVP